jgi:ubiquinone/menaquinone biosynthesis C-methylase UbiE
MTLIEGLVEQGEAFRRLAWSSPEAAAAWQRMADARNASLATATERMLARACIRPGMRVLVLGAGSGDDAVLVAKRVGSTGHVLATDVSQAMVEACEATTRMLGLSWVESRVMDAAAADVAPGSFDAVVSRHGLMFTPHLERALAGARAALRPGGHFAMTCWGPLENNPMADIAAALARRLGLPLEPHLEAVRAFSLSDANALAAALARAGFAEVAIDRERRLQRFASAADAVDVMRRSPVAEFFEPLDDAQRADAWAELERAYAQFATAEGWAAYGESLVASGLAEREE